MSTTNEPDFDWAQAASLLGDEPDSVEPDMVEIVVELVENADKQFAELKARKADTQRKEIGAQAHQLRGSLLNFGFIAVGEVLLKIEKDNYPAAEYPAMVAEAEKLFVASKKLLAARYTSLQIS